MYSISFILHKYADFNEPNVGGASKNPIKIIKSLKQNVKINDLIFFNGNKLESKEIQLHLYKIRLVKLFLKTLLQNIMIIRQLVKVFKKSDILQIHHPHYGLTAVLLRDLFFKKKIIITKAHGTSIPELAANKYKGLKGYILFLDSLIHFKIDRYVLSKSNKVICSSKFQLLEMQQLYGVNKTNLVSIYNGYDPDFIKDRNSSDTLQFVFCGRIVPKKNIVYAIELFNLIQKKFVNSKLKLILGEYNKIEDGETFKKIIKIVGNNPNIELLFDLSEYQLYKVYKESHIGLITSVGYESIPTVLFEMLGSGIRVFSSYNWGIPEIITSESSLSLDLLSDYNKIESFLITEFDDFFSSQIDYSQYSIKVLAKEYLNIYKEFIK